MSKIKLKLNQEKVEIFERIKPYPPKNIAHSVSSFEITTDSIVAKATVVTDTATKRISIDWGDGQNDTIYLVPGRPFNIERFTAAVSPPLVRLPEGTYEIFHAYDEPEDRRTFVKTVFLNVADEDGGNDIRLKEITLTPRYRIVHYQTRFQIPDGCDFGFEIQNFKIVMSLGGTPIHEYAFDIPDNPAGSVKWHLLEGSQFYRELSDNLPTDGSAIVHFDFTDEDSILDDHGTHSTTLNYTMVTGPVESQFELSDFWGVSCRVKIRYDREVTLISNIPQAAAPSSYNAGIQ